MITKIGLICFAMACADFAHAQSTANDSPRPAEATLGDRPETPGNSAIRGRVFAKDGPRSLLPRLNLNARQYPPPGTPVILLPYTSELKEWLGQADRGKQLPPLDGMLSALRSTPTGPEGEYEFAGLAPGKYLLYTEFGYQQTARKTHVVGYTDHYMGNLYQGSSPIKHHEYFYVGADARIEEVVNIRKDGVVVKQDLKRTR